MTRPVSGASWIIDTLVGFLCPDMPAVAHTIITAPTIAEFWMIAYLVIKGVREPAARQLDPAAALVAPDAEGDRRHRPD